MKFTPVPAQQQDAIRQPQRAAWFAALLDAGMLEVSARPTLSKAQQQVLDEQGQRLRSRVVDGKTYIWVEDIPSPDLSEDGPVADDDLPLD